MMIIHLTGADTYRSQRRFGQLRDAFRAKHDRQGLNTVVLDGQTVTAEELRTAATTVSFLSTKRFIGINAYDSRQSSCSPEQLGLVLAPLANSPDVIVVIREVQPPNRQAGRIKARVRATRAAGVKITGADDEEFLPLAPAATRRWLLKEAISRGGKISTPAADLLLDYFPDDLWRLSNELDKLVAYAGSRAITPADVDDLVRAPEVSDVFALTDALGQRQTATALRLLRQELAAGTHPLALISLLATHVRNLLLVQSLGQKIHQPNAIASDLKLHPFVVRKALAQSQNFPATTLRRWHHQLVEIDAAVKSSPLDAETLLDLLIVQAA